MGQKQMSISCIKLKGVNESGIPITCYFEMVAEFLGLKVSKVSSLGHKESKTKNKQPGMVGWNLMELAYQEFTQKVYRYCVWNFWVYD